MVSQAASERGDNPDIETCLAYKEQMDTYIEKTLSCMEKPVYSLESIESQMAAISSIHNDRKLAEMLSLSFDKMVSILEDSLSETEKGVQNLDSFLVQMEFNMISVFLPDTRKI